MDGTILVIKLERKTKIGKLVCTWENNIKTDLKETRCVNTLKTLRVSQNMTNFLTS